KSLFDTQVIHKLVITYKDYDGKMYPNYIYYETPKLVNTGDRSSDRIKTEAEPGFDKDAQYITPFRKYYLRTLFRNQNLLNRNCCKTIGLQIFFLQNHITKLFGETTMFYWKAR